ncbi:MAG: DNA polymerase III subunit chi [gamma proteobacterium symbiont of Taylorina sp.]|nr:DNA polymerase III subunit chi [gamma proteobacterium symbiont of Taylorina sp.]
MTQVDFYILADNSAKEIKQICCQLCEKALQQDMNVFIYTQSFEQAEELDNLLWSYKPNSFMVHINELNQIDKSDILSNLLEKNECFHYPVIISSTTQPAPEYQDLLINLTAEPHPSHQQFKRIAEIVDRNPQAKQQARKLYRFYQQQDYPLKKYDL